MKNASAVSSLSLVLLATLALTAHAQTLSTWKGGTGSWDDSANWTGPVPNSANADVRIDNGLATNSEATLMSDVIVGRLTLTSSDTVIVPDGRRLTISNGSAFTGQGTMSGGRFEFDGATGGAVLFADGDVTVSSTVVGSFDGANILTGTTGSTVTINTIFFTGFTQIGSGAVNVVVNGSLSTSTQATGSTITPATSFVLNENAGLSVPRMATLGGTGAFTLNGTVSMTANSADLPCTLTRDATSTLTNFDGATRTLNGGRYLLLNLDGATVNLNVGPIFINNAEIEMVRAGSSFAGLEQIQTNSGSLTFNNRAFAAVGSFANSGSFTVASNTFTATGMTNSGTVKILSFSGGSAGTITLGAGGYTQTAGSLGLNGTTVVTPMFNSTGPFVINGGRLEGGGRITASVQCNGGTIAPFTNNNQYSALDIVGPLTLGAGATVEIRAGASNQFGRRNDSVGATGALVIAGELKLYVGSVADPNPAFTYSVLGGASLTGTFSNIVSGERLRTQDGRGSFLVTISNTTVSLSEWVPTPARAIGVAVPGEPVGTVFAKLGPPAQGPFGGALKANNRTAVAIFAGDGRVRAVVGGITPLAPIETLYSKLGEPSGDAALATVRTKAGSITSKNDQLLLGGLIAGPVRIAVREGITEVDGLPGVTVKSFVAIEGSPTAGAPIFFRAMLQGGDTTSKDDMALCAALADGTLRVLVREGQEIVSGGKKVTIIGTLVAAKGTPAEGRWRAGDEALGVRLSFSDKSNAIYSIPVAATSPMDWELALDTATPLGAPLAGVNIASLGLPGFGAQSVAFLAKLKTAPNLVKSSDDQALFVSDANGLALLAREGSPAAGVLEGKYKTFSDPVSGASGDTAVLGTATVGKKSGTYLWHAPAGDSLALLTSVGENAPGGGKFASFTSLAFPDGPTSGPLFTAKLANSSTNLPAITGKNNFGLWAVDSTGTLVKLLRTGDTIRFNGEDREVKSFTALVTAPGSIGAARGYDHTGNVTVLATFVDKKVNNIALTKSGLVQLAIP